MNRASPARPWPSSCRRKSRRTTCATRGERPLTRRSLQCCRQTRRQRGVVFDQSDIGGQAASAGALEQERQKERRHGLADDATTSGFSNRLIDEDLHLVSGNLISLRDRIGYENATAKTQRFLGVNEISDRPGTVEPHRNGQSASPT